MNQKPQKSAYPLVAAALMVAAGACFAMVNAALQTATMKLGMPSSSAVFWQYAAALCCALPWLVRHGRSALVTRRPMLHGLRILFAVAGVQLWGAGLASVPIWQAIALVMTSPFFVIIGAKLLLREKVGLARWGATLAGFTGAMIILEPWADGFRLEILLPVAAAAFWGGASLITKILTRTEPADTVTVYLLLLLTPVNFLLASAEGFIVPTGWTLAAIAAAGVFTIAANYTLTLAYSKADAAFIQPFDHLKLPLNIFAGWVAFGFAPDGYFWPGALMIVGASLYVMQDEQYRARAQRLDDMASQSEPEPGK
ncbi:DMT family transporter [Roseibium suaedae]|uniref:Permease of the drug/metabolite transporter (DMT) superfamily n=1 Tax=Roseibium suaedae TaxID=735517 RepID=A0A1M7FR79_9HYPH|nr:DMT family transporter [Roseibium suaedae]SHM06574.1 Permease of the drug/metabolite transporter (DMT) superfamily [Roseibium suaedae]